MSFSSLLAQYLPPPQFLKMPSLGVDISDTSLKYIQFGEGKKNMRPLVTWGEIDIPSGILERGYVHDQKKLTDVLKECKAKTDATFVRVSLPEERAYLFETEIKRSTPTKEIRSLLEFRLEENVPIPARDAFFDFDILAGETNDKTIQVVVAAYARETILNYFDACNEAGLVPIAFEVEAQAMVRSVLPTGMRGAHMLVDFGKTRTGVGIVLDGKLMYTSTIDFGGNQLSEVLRKVHGQITEGELTTIKNTQGLIKGVHDTRSYDALISTMSVIKDELASRIQYWHSSENKTESRRIQSVILCGGSSNLKGLPEYFTETLGVPTSRASVWQNAFSVHNYIPPISIRHSYGYATAIGLALPPDTSL
ncbi:MAG: type 4 fimbrial biosis protein PilM, type pilus assembly protein PilM [Candidatus Parcubacteria bacterium]